MKFLKFDSVYRGLKHEHVTGFSGRDRLLSSWIINEFLSATYARFKSNQRNQKVVESFDAYLTALRNTVETCNFCSKQWGLVTSRSYRSRDPERRCQETVASGEDARPEEMYWHLPNFRELDSSPPGAWWETWSGQPGRPKGQWSF